jgi:hypothetical protein
VYDRTVLSAGQTIMDSQELAASGLVAERLSRGFGSVRAATAAADIAAAQLLLVLVTGAIGCAATITWWRHMQVI